MIECDWCGKQMRLGEMIFAITEQHCGDSLSPENMEEICYRCAAKIEDIKERVIRERKAKTTNTKVGEVNSNG